MVENFEVGKYYKWVGPSSYNDNWAGHMDAILDRKPHKVLSSHGAQNVGFEGVHGTWDWRHVREYFVECVTHSKAGKEVFYIKKDDAKERWSRILGEV